MQQRTNISLGLIGLAAIALLGCQRIVNVPQGRLADTPMGVDEAMLLRDWEPSIAYYEDPAFIAGPTGFLFQPAYEQPNYMYALMETPMFVAQTLALPVTLVMTPPLTPLRYSGETIPPTHHGMPPLPAPPRGSVVEPPHIDRDPTVPPMLEPQPTRAPDPQPVTPEAEFPLPTQPTRGIEAAPAPATQPRAVRPAAPPTRPAGPQTRPAQQIQPPMPIQPPRQQPPRTPQAAPATRPAAAPATLPANK